MILHIESDAAYLVMPHAKIRIAGYYYCGTTPLPVPALPSLNRNAPLQVICKILRHVVALAAEAETAGLFFNTQEAIPIRYIFPLIGHPQPKTPIQTDNSKAMSFITKNIKQKRSKSWEMRYNW